MNTKTCVGCGRTVPTYKADSERLVPHFASCGYPCLVDAGCSPAFHEAARAACAEAGEPDVIKQVHESAILRGLYHYGVTESCWKCWPAQHEQRKQEMLRLLANAEMCK